jgi:hypothetical protein
MVVAVAIQVCKYGAMLFASRFLAVNARMVVVMAVAIQVGKYGATVFASRFLATNARMHECLWLCLSPQKHTIRAFVAKLPAAWIDLGFCELWQASSKSATEISLQI